MQILVITRRAPEDRICTEQIHLDPESALSYERSLKLAYKAHYTVLKEILPASFSSSRGEKKMDKKCQVIDKHESWLLILPNGRSR